MAYQDNKSIRQLNETAEMQDADEFVVQKDGETFARKVSKENAHKDLATKTELENHTNNTDNPHNTSWDNLQDKPTEFPPESHTHTESEITDLDKYTQAQVDTLLDDKADTNHTHAIDDVTNLQTELDGKSDVGHTHTESEITDLDKYTQAQVNTLLGGYQLTSEKGQANGYASLDANAKIPESQLPSIAIAEVYVVADIPARDALSPEKGDVAIVEDASGDPEVDSGSKSYIYDGTAWQRLRVPDDVVLSVNGQTGAVTLTKSDVGLGNVDNTSDADKPISTATQTALDDKADQTDLDTHINDTENPHEVTLEQTLTQDNNAGGNSILNAPLAINTVATEGYTLVLTDANKLIDMTSQDLKTLTVPNNSSVAFPIGTYIYVKKTDGILNFAEDTGVTINTPSGFSSLAGDLQYAKLYKVGTDEWDIDAELVPDFVGFLDDYNLITTGIYSVRRARSDYSGALLRIRRESDDEEMDIGFDSEGNLDELDFISFVGIGNSGRVVTWYDQSGNGRDATQSDKAAQPEIRIDEINGRPAVYFGGSQQLRGDSLVSGNSARTIFLTTMRDSSGLVGMVDLSQSSSSGVNYSITPEIGVRIFGGRIVYSQQVSATNPTILTLQNSEGGNVIATKAWRNGSEMSVSSSSSNTINTASDGFIIGNSAQGSIDFYQGWVQEFFVMVDDVSDVIREEIEQNQMEYYVQPDIKLLDEAPDAVGAYGLRKLRTNYTGDAVRVRRTSDNNEKDIGFLANGDLDIDDLEDFIGVSDGRVVTLYDQSGNNFDFVQATAGKQLRIAESGIVNTINGRPFIERVSITDSLEIVSSAGLDMVRNVFDFRVYIVAREAETNSPTRQLFFANTNSSSAAARFAVEVNRTNNRWALGGRRLDSNSFQSIVHGTNHDTLWHQITAIANYTSATATIRMDGSGSVQSFQTAGNTSNTASSHIATSADSGDTFPMASNFSEIICYADTVHSSSVRDFIESNQMFYYGL